MIINIKPYYCPHCHKFKDSFDTYKSSGCRSETPGIMVVGTMRFCNGCDTAVLEVKPEIEKLIQTLMEQRHTGRAYKLT